MPQTAEQQTRLRSFTRRLRDERFGGNDSALARAMGVNQSTVHRFLSGKTIRLDVMEKIAKVAGVKLAVLLDGEPPPLPDNDQEPIASPAPPPDRAAGAHPPPARTPGLFESWGSLTPGLCDSGGGVDLARWVFAYTILPIMRSRKTSH